MLADSEPRGSESKEWITIQTNEDNSTELPRTAVSYAKSEALGTVCSPTYDNVERCLSEQIAHRFLVAFLSAVDMSSCLNTVLSVI